MFCDNCKFYQLEEVEYEGGAQKVKLCVGSGDATCPAETAFANMDECEGDTARDKALNAGLHPTELHWVD